MTITNNNSYIDDRLVLLPEDYREMLGSGYIQEVTQLIASGYELGTEHITILQNNTALFLLFLLKKDVFLLNLQEQLGITDIDAKNIYEILLSRLPIGAVNFLEDYENTSPVENTNLKTDATKKSELASLAQTFAKKEPERLENPEIQNFTSNVEPLRTMEGDINRVHGYGALNEEKGEEGIAR